MKIFIVCSRLGYGGAEHVATMWANGFVEQGHDVTLISNLFEKTTFPINEEVKIYNLVTTVDSSRKKWISAIKNVRKLAKEKRPDVIICVMRICSMVAKVAVAGLGIPVIATEHNAYEWPESNPMPFNARFFKFHLSKFYDGVTVLTHADKTLVKNKLNNVTVIPNPLSLAPAESSNLHKENIVLAVGRLDAWKVKGFDILLQAWSKIISNEQLEISNYDYSQDGKPSHWWLKIAGDGKKESFEYLMNLLPDGEWTSKEERRERREESAVWRSGKYRIEFLGFRKDIEELYKKSSIFVLSSRYEGFGLVLIEAMSQGCAPVACDYKGRQREILNPSSALPEGEGEPNRKIEITENGILCEPDNVEALASALEKMIADTEYRESIRSNVIDRSKYYSIENIIKQWEGLLNKVIK